MPGCVECIVFVFGSKPFAVNDIVMIEGKPYTVVQIGLLETRLRDPANKITRMSNQRLCDQDILNLSYGPECAISIIKTEISISTPLEQLERLRQSILSYTMRNPQHWKPRVNIHVSDITQANAVLLELRVESKIAWREPGSFRSADFGLRKHVCAKLVKLGIQYASPRHPVIITADAGASPAAQPF